MFALSQSEAHSSLCLELYRQLTQTATKDWDLTDRETINAVYVICAIMRTLLCYNNLPVLRSIICAAQNYQSALRVEQVRRSAAAIPIGDQTNGHFPCIIHNSSIFSKQLVRQM